MKPFILTLIVCTFTALSTLHADPAKDAAMEKYLELTNASEIFKTAAKAGLESGFDPKNNPQLAMIPPAKLEKIKVELGKLFSTDFSYDVIKPAMKEALAKQYTTKELNEINGYLDNPLMKKFFKKQANMIPEVTKLSQEAVKPLQPKIIAITQKIMLER